MGNIEDNRLIIGEKIRKRRIELGYTQEKLAELLDYNSKSSINKIEKGINDFPKSKLILFAKVLKTDISYFLNDDEKEEPEHTKNSGTYYFEFKTSNLKDNHYTWLDREKQTKDLQNLYKQIENIVVKCYGDKIKSDKENAKKLRKAITTSFISEIEKYRKEEKK